MEENLYNELNEQIEQEGKHWIAGETTVSVLSDFQQQMRLGCLPEPDEEQTTFECLASRKDEQDLKHTFNRDIPTVIDWRSYNGHNYITKVKDQGSCGSCVAFGTIGAIESRVRIIGNAPLDLDNQSVLPLLSEAQLFFCGGGGDGRTCGNGWWVGGALSYCRTNGLAPESYFPYKAKDQGCAVKAGWEAKITKLFSYHEISNVNSMKEYLATKGPLVTRFDVYNDFYNYKSGVYHRTNKAIYKGGHCVTCVGYDETKQAWLCKNSWGTRWGMQGFFYIGYNECGIDSSMYHAESFSRIFPLYMDFFLRDNLRDFSQIPTTGTLTASPDIVPLGITIPDPNTLKSEWYKDVGTNIMHNCSNLIYIRGNNLLPNKQSVKLSLYYSKASLLLYPRQWKDNVIKANDGMANILVSVQEQGERVVVPDAFVWRPDALEKNDHYCLIARAETTTHPNPVPDIEKMTDFAKFISENPGFAWRNVAITDANIPSYNVALQYEQGTVGETVYFVIVASEGLVGASVSLSCGSSIPNPVINIPKTEIKQDKAILGVCCDIPANFKGTLLFNYWKGENSKPWVAQVQAFYVVKERELEGYAVELRSGITPLKGVLIGDYTIRGE